MDDDKKRQKMQQGSIGWVDLTVPDARGVRDFYAGVVGWNHEAVPMGEYTDFCMIPSGSDDPVAGICHARTVNEGHPAQWLIYLTVADLQTSIDQCEHLGGKVVFGPKNMGDGSSYCVIQDPAGAHVALYEETE